MLVGPHLHILKLPNFFKALYAIDDGGDLSNESRRTARLERLRPN